MKGVVLPGDSSVSVRDFPVPRVERGQVLIKMAASAICESDIREIYRQHAADGSSAYNGVICGQECCGRVESVGDGVQRLRAGDKVVVYPASGCGECPECRHGYGSECRVRERGVYGRTRNGGMAEFLLAEESDCLRLPGRLSYVDGAHLACTFGPAWEALSRMRVGEGESLLVSGANPSGLAAMMLARCIGVQRVIAVDGAVSRRRLVEELALADAVFDTQDLSAEEIVACASNRGCDAAIDCLGDPAGRMIALRGTARWGRVAFLGEGNSMLFAPGPDVIRRQITIYGTSGTSRQSMASLLELLERVDLQPSKITTHCFSFEEIERAFRAADLAHGQGGKVSVVFDDAP